MPTTASPRKKTRSIPTSPGPAPASAQTRQRIGHTCAWTVTGHLGRPAFGELKRFAGVNPSQEASIRRKQLEIAVREASEETGRKLRLVRREVLDMTDTRADVFPVLARADRAYDLEQNLFYSTHDASFRALAAHFRAVRGTVHTTIAAGIIKRYARDALRGFPLRAHGGVYFVSEKLEANLFALSDFLQGSGIGHITRITIGAGKAERVLISDEIQRITQKQIDGLREAFGESDLSDPKDRERLRGKVAEMRREIAEMQDLFGFAKKVLAEKDRKARTLMKHVLRGQRSLPDDLFGSAESKTDEETPLAFASGNRVSSSGAFRNSTSGDGQRNAPPQLGFSA